MFGRFIGPSRSISYENFTEFTTAGAHTFTVPDGVYQIGVGIWGSGGSGGAGASGGGGGFHYDQDGSGGPANGGSAGSPGLDGNNGSKTTVTRDANSFLYEASGGAGGYGTQAVEGGGCPGPVRTGVGGSYVYPDYAGGGDTRSAAGGAGDYQSGNPGQGGGDAAHTFVDDGSNEVFFRGNGFTSGDGGAGGAGVTYQGKTFGKGGDGGNGGGGGIGAPSANDIYARTGGPGGYAGGAAGGGSGGFTFKMLSVSPGETFTIDVAAGGAVKNGPAGGDPGARTISGGSDPNPGNPGGDGQAGQDGAVVIWY